MTVTFNVYCDESCHLEKDHQKVMVLGALWCPKEKTPEIFRQIREIKVRHGLNPNFEIKWIKVSPGKVLFYLDIVDFFFSNSNLHYRALIVSDKSKLQHEKFGQTHDEWYYKMYFELLKVIFKPFSKYRIYSDIKDTKGGEKVKKLHEVLSNSLRDFSREIVERVQQVRSNEVQLIQVCDLLTGIISYENREMKGSPAKEALVKRMREKSNMNLTSTTNYLETKVNLLRWEPAKI